VITDEEKERIEALNLANDPEVAPKPWFAPVGRGSKNWRLRHRPDGGCVFLTTANHCRLSFFPHVPVEPTDPPAMRPPRVRIPARRMILLVAALGARLAWMLRIYSRFGAFSWIHAPARWEGELRERLATVVEF